VRKLSLLILGAVLLGGMAPAHAANPTPIPITKTVLPRTPVPTPIRVHTPTPTGTPVPTHPPVPSEWSSLDADGAMSNHNEGEKDLTPANVLRLKVRWTAPLPDVSYPIVSGNRVYAPVVGKSRKVHVRVLDVATGKQIGLLSVEALGGMLAANGKLYAAGRKLTVVDTNTGEKVTQIEATPSDSKGIFLDPVTDHRLILAGYASTRKNVPAGLYGIDPGFNKVVWKVPSTSAQGAMTKQRVFTRITAGSAFYDETTGKQIISHPSIFSDWFAGSKLAYTVTSLNKTNAALYAFDDNGRRVWKHTVGPYMIAGNWPHAVNGSGLYVQVLRPFRGVEGIDPLTGHVIWRRPIPDVERLALANGMLFVLAYSLGQPVRLIALKAKTGALIGGIILSTGYYAFASLNGLMVADGMVFIRAVGPGGSQLVALGL
jgi:hypothetical protein